MQKGRVGLAELKGVGYKSASAASPWKGEEEEKKMTTTLASNSRKKTNFSASLLCEKKCWSSARLYVSGANPQEIHLNARGKERGTSGRHCILQSKINGFTKSPISWGVG